MNFSKENIIKYAIYISVTFFICALIILLVFAFKFLGNPARADIIYQQALKDLQTSNYSNAYFQFSKVSYLSKLKPYAIFHRAECAKALGDKNSEQKQYYLLFNVYPHNELSLKAKYLYASELENTNPRLARKYFESIAKNHPETDYALGSKYHIATLLTDKNERNSEQIISCAREYLETAPVARWSVKLADLWQQTIPTLSTQDKIFLAKIYLQNKEIQKAEKLLENTPFNETWNLQAKIELAKGFVPLQTLKTGLNQLSSKVSDEDKNEIISRVLQNSKDKKSTLLEILQASANKNDLFLQGIKCRYVEGDNSQNACYSNLVKYSDKLPESILQEVFLNNIWNSNYSVAKKLGNLYLEKFSKSKSTPLVMYWLGKIYKQEKKTLDANEYFRKVITTYPDSYYAFRSYLRLNDIGNSIIANQIEPKEILFPYFGQVNSTVLKLIEFKDYSVLEQIYENDKFVQSWLMYEKGNKSQAMCVARDAMANLEEKPERTDLRWRLVYPTFLYDEMAFFAKPVSNNPVLMLALAREESYFNEKIKSSVGAVGLMQLMPETAIEINSMKNLNLQNVSELLSPQMNMKVGNYYYSYLLSNLANNNILSVIAYNGGIGSISRWKQGLDYNDIDEFIEKIPYPETKNYVRKVYRTYWNYARLY